ncbi:MAG: hypothetical protein ABIF77_12550, partial [bacterium]
MDPETFCRGSLTTLHMNNPASPEVMWQGPYLSCNRGLGTWLGDTVLIQFLSPYRPELTRAYDISDPTTPVLVEEGLLPAAFGAMRHPESILGYHCIHTDSTVTIYDMTEPLDPVLIAEWETDQTIESIVTLDDQVVAYTEGKLTILEFLPDLIAPILDLTLRVDTTDATLLHAILSADEPMNPAASTLALDGVGLPCSATSDTTLQATIPTTASGHFFLTGSVADLAGNHAVITRPNAAYLIGSAGGRLTDPTGRIALEIPGGA